MRSGHTLSGGIIPAGSGRRCAGIAAHRNGGRGVESLLEELARLVARDDLSHLEPHHTPIDLAAPRAAPDERGLRALPRVYVSCGAAILTNAFISAASQASPTLSG